MNRLVVLSLLFEMQFGLTKLESIRLVNNLVLSQAKETLPIDRRIAHNQQHREIPIVHESQKQLIFQRINILQTHYHAEYPETVILNRLYNAYRELTKLPKNLRLYYLKKRNEQLSLSGVSEAQLIKTLKQENEQLIQENREAKTRLSVKLSDEVELKKIIEDLKIKNHKLKTKLEVEILEKEFDLPKEPESQLYKNFLKSLDQDSIQQTIDNLANNIKSNKGYDTKKNSLYVLATIKDEKVYNLFSKLVTDKDWLIRFHLIKAIEKSRNIDHKEILSRLLEDRDVDVREAAKNALSKL